MIFLMLIFSQLGLAAQYTCDTVFGETVPIRIIALKKNVVCTGCESVQAVVPLDLVKQKQVLNLGVVSDPTLSTTVKRRIFKRNGYKIFMDTRYAKRKGPSFRFQLECLSHGKCESYFLDKADKKMPKDAVLRLDARKVYDQRIANNLAFVELGITRRKYSGFIARVFKQKIPVTKKLVMGTSSSGEIKFFEESSTLSMDAGADEQIELMPGVRTRIAAFEVKIECFIE